MWLDLIFNPPQPSFKKGGSPPLSKEGLGEIKVIDIVVKKSYLCDGFFIGSNMPKLVKRLYAIGTRGHAKGEVFEANKNSNSKYVLNVRKISSSPESTNRAVNKVEVDTLNEAYELLKKDLYLINLTDGVGKRALRNLKSVKIEYV